MVDTIGGLEGIGLRFHLEDQIDDVLERQIVSVRAMPAAPSQVITHSFLGNAGERVIDGIDAPPGELAVGLDRRFGLQHVPPVRQAWVVDLQDEAGGHHRPVLLTQRVRQSEQEFVLGAVVLVEDEMVEPAGREDRDECFVDLGTRPLDRRLESCRADG